MWITKVCFLAVTFLTCYQQQQSSFQLVDISSLLTELGITLDELEKLSQSSGQPTAINGLSSLDRQQQRKIAASEASPTTQQKRNEQTSSSPRNIIGPGPVDSSLPPVLDLSSSNGNILREASTLPLPNNTTPVRSKTTTMQNTSTSPINEHTLTLSEQSEDALTEDNLESNYGQTIKAPIPFFEPLVMPDKPDAGQGQDRTVWIPGSPQDDISIITLNPRLQPKEIQNSQETNNQEQLTSKVSVSVSSDSDFRQYHHSNMGTVSKESLKSGKAQRPKESKQPPHLSSNDMSQNHNYSPMTSFQTSSPEKPGTTTRHPTKASHDFSSQISPVNVPFYDLTPSYQQFSQHYIVSSGDPNLPVIQEYLLTHYGNYLRHSWLVAGFKKYAPEYTEYRLLSRTKYGTFLIIVDCGAAQSLRLKSLALINFDIQAISYSHCAVKDLQLRNCSKCIKGYRNFRGRCRLEDPHCTLYVTDECLECTGGFRVSKGRCLE